MSQGYVSTARRGKKKCPTRRSFRGTEQYMAIALVLMGRVLISKIWTNRKDVAFFARVLFGVLFGVVFAVHTLPRNRRVDSRRISKIQPRARVGT